MLEATNIAVKAAGRTIVNGASVYVRPGEVVGIVGANGAGKSSLLKVLSGDVTPSAGEVSFENRLLKEWEPRALAKLRSVLPQYSDLNFALSAYEVVMLGRHPHILGSETPDDHRIVTEILELVDAVHLADQSYPTLSGGEKQRIHLARVLAQIFGRKADMPAYLLLDEPTSSLDLLHQHLTMEVIRNISKANTGVLIVLHDLVLAAAYTDRIYMMKGGDVYAEGRPQDALAPDSIKDVFNMTAERYKIAVSLMMQQVNSVAEVYK